MADSFERVGLESVFETAEFKKGLAEYIAGVTKATKATTRAQASTEKLSFDKATNRWRNAAGQFATNAQMVAAGVKSAGGAAATAATGGFAAIASGALAVVGALTAIVGVAVKATTSLIAFGKSALFTAGRVDELNRVALLLGQNTGRSQEEVQGFLDGLRDMGIRADVGAKLVAQLARRNLDLAQSTELAAVAQDAAVLSGQDSSDALDKLVLGITTYNTRILRTAGLNVNMQQAFEAMAKGLGKTKEELTEAEKIQAAFNATLDEGSRIAGVYSVAQDSPTKALRSLGREMFNLRAEVGGPFLSAWKSIIDVARSVVQAFTRMVSEGGLLRPLLINLGAAASIMADGIKKGALIVINAVEGLQLNANTRFSEMVENALTWGVEIATALADGIVKGASFALTAAMNVIQNLLTSWLSPGSPPKVAPHIGKWGADAFTEYLRGFGKADFGVLKGLQSILGKFLEKTELQDITLDIGTAIATGPTAAFFEKIRAAAGEFGAEIVSLAQNYFALADAVGAAEQAQNDLDDALERLTESKGAVKDLTGEYNRLLKAGASDEVLQAQLAQINAAEESLTLAQEQAKQAEEAKAAAEAQIQTIKEETALQEELVNQLLALAEEEAKAKRETEEKEKKKKPKKGTPEAIGEGIGAGLGAGITTGIQAAIEEAKAKLLAKLGNIFEPLRTRWNNSIKPTLKELVERFLEFKDDVADAWEEIQARVDPILETLREWWEDKLPDAMRTMQKMIDFTLKPALKRVWAFVQQFLNPEFSLLSDVILPAIKTASEAIATFWDETLLPALKGVRDFIKDKLIETLNDFRVNVIQPLIDVFDGWKAALEGLEERLANIWALVQSILDVIDDIKPPQFDVAPDTSGNSFVPVQPQFAAGGAGGGMGGSGGDTFNFGNNNISDPMAFAAFEARVIQIIRRELGR